MQEKFKNCFRKFSLLVIRAGIILGMVAIYASASRFKNLQFFNAVIIIIVCFLLFLRIEMRDYGEIKIK